MHKKFPFAFVAALLLLAMACKKDLPYVNCNSPINDLALAQKLIVGNWQWEEEYFRTRGFDPVTYTRQNTTRNWRMHFSEDNKVQLFSDNALLEEIEYKMRPTKDLYPSRTDDLSTRLWMSSAKDSFYFRTSWIRFNICNDTLYLDLNADYDGRGRDKWSKQ